MGDFAASQTMYVFVAFSPSVNGSSWLRLVIVMHDLIFSWVICILVKVRVAGQSNVYANGKEWKMGGI